MLGLQWMGSCLSASSAYNRQCLRSFGFESKDARNRLIEALKLTLIEIGKRILFSRLEGSVPWLISVTSGCYLQEGVAQLSAGNRPRQDCQMQFISQGVSYPTKDDDG